jgi:hypothetical protein
MDHMSRDALSLEVRAFVAQHLHLPLDEVSLHSRLRDNLGVDGDAAGALMAAFAIRFGANLSDFRFTRHFRLRAGCNPLLWLPMARWRGLPDVPLTVGDLVVAAAAGRWVMRYPEEPFPRWRG